MDQKINSVIAISFLFIIAALLGSVTWYYGNKGMAEASVLKIKAEKHIDSEIK